MLFPDPYKKVFDDLQTNIAIVEKALADTADTSDGNVILHKISTLEPLLALTPKMLSDATILVGYTKKNVSDEALFNEKLMNAKVTVQRVWLDSKLSEIEALYVKTERLQKNLDLKLELMRSKLSYERELLRQSSFGGQT